MLQLVDNFLELNIESLYIVSFRIWYFQTQNTWFIPKNFDSFKQLDHERDVVAGEIARQFLHLLPHKTQILDLKVLLVWVVLFEE